MNKYIARRCINGEYTYISSRYGYWTKDINNAYLFSVKNSITRFINASNTNKPNDNIVVLEITYTPTGNTIPIEWYEEIDSKGNKRYKCRCSKEGSCPVMPVV